MKTMIRASAALALLATLGMSAAFAQAPAARPPPRRRLQRPPPRRRRQAADDILDTAAKAGNFKTLAKALDAADLTKVLKGKGPFTVFAPTDEAFAKIPKEQLEALLLPENKRSLASTLSAHVVAGKASRAERFVRPRALSAHEQQQRLALTPRTRPRGSSSATPCHEGRHRGVERRHPRRRYGVCAQARARGALRPRPRLTQAKAAAGPALEKAKEVGGKALEKAKEVGGKAVEATKDAAGKAVDKAKEMTAPATTPAPANK